MRTAAPNLDSPPSEEGRSLLDVDPAFARAVPEADRALAARTLTLRERVVASGGGVASEEPDVVALLVVSGAIWREVHVGRARAPQLLGTGAVILCAPVAGGRLAAHARSVALTHTRLAVLDRRFLLAAARWPPLAGVLHARLADQERDVGVQAAILQLPRVDDRLVTLLWHLAERWGRADDDGVHVALRLTHATLGRFVGARRPTVSLALTQLRRDGVLDRDDDGCWLLLGAPPAAVDGHVRAPDLFGSAAPA